MVYKKGQKDAIPEERPLQRSIDAIEAALKVRNRLWEKILFSVCNTYNRLIPLRYISVFVRHFSRK